MSTECKKTEKRVLAEVDEVMALVHDFDTKGWLAAQAKLDGDEALNRLQAEAEEAEQVLRAKLQELCTAAVRQRETV